MNVHKEIRRHQIEELLLNAHLESEGGIDLIEEYFCMNRSLDHVTRQAQVLLQSQSDRQMCRVVLKNLAECIVVKNQRDQHTLWGLCQRFFRKIGWPMGKRGDILRAENLVDTYRHLGRDGFNFD